MGSPARSAAGHSQSRVPSVSQVCWCGCSNAKRSPSIPGRLFMPSTIVRLSGRSSGKLPRIASRLGCWRAASTARALESGSHPGGWIRAALTPPSSISFSTSAAVKSVTWR